MPTSPGSDPAPGFKTGFGSYAFRWSVELDGLRAPALLEKASRMGAEVVQLCDNLPVLTFSDAELAGLRAQAGALGLVLETGMKGGTAEGLLRGLRAARGMGSRVLRVVLAANGWEPTAPEVESILRGILPALHGEGIALALENHFDLTPTELVTLVETIGDPLVGICLDPFNSIAHLVDPQETVRLLAPYAITAHIKDARAGRHKTGFYVQGCPLGEGALDLAGMLAALRSTATSTGCMPALLLEAWLDRAEDDGETCALEVEWNRVGLERMQILVNESRRS